MAGWGLWGSRPRRTGLSAATDGWDDAGRRAHLHRVVNLCRFLVRPGVSCLPSHVLGRVVRAAGNDFDARYGYPCLRLLKTGMRERVAANWAGETAGRGRQGRNGNAKGCYELDAGWRERFSEPLAPLDVGAGLDRKSWQEFGGAPLGDARLSARLVTCAHHQGAGRSQALRGEIEPRPTTVSSTSRTTRR